MNTENNGNENKLTNRDLWKVFLHQLIIRGANNYECQQNTGSTEAMMPMVEKYYEDPEKKKEVYTRHMEYLLTNDITSAVPVGVAAAMEGQYTTEGDIDPGSISAVKITLMGPLVGLEDSSLNGTARPILIDIVISLITARLGWIGPIFFVVGMPIVSLGVRYLEVFQGHEQGVEFVEKVQSSGLTSRILELAAIAAYVIVGGSIPALVIISIPIMCQSGDTVLNIRETPDGLISGILGMLYTGLIYLLISKKKISAVKLILVTVIVGTMGTYHGILG